MFKVGDKVRRVAGSSFLSGLQVNYGCLYVVKSVSPSGAWLGLVGQSEGDPVPYCAEAFELVEDTNKKPHKHAELIKAWADGAKIQYRRTGHMDWQDIDRPSWGPYEYRIKPEPKPDSIKFGGLVDASEFMVVVWHTSKKASDNVKATFDGETGKLKAIELLVI